MYLGTISGIDYYHVESVNKDMILATSESNIEFVTEETYAQLKEEVHEKMSYLAYVRSMSIWLLFLLAGTVTSCKVNPYYGFETGYLYEEHGDPRFDECKDIYTQMYAINVYGDTLPIRKIYSIDCYEGRLRTHADKTIDYGKVD